MENAWLDSLSEDWISQPRSAGSPDRSLPSFQNSSPTSESCNERNTSSRLPLPKMRRQSHIPHHNSVNLPLSERSSSDNNISLSQRVLKKPSGLRKDISNSIRGRRLSRTASDFTTESVKHDTVQHKSHSSSPQKLRRPQDTPEWKRRLLHGEVAYGEQRDLFSPAGLENIFRPPPPQAPSSFSSPERVQVEDLTMPSSPPPYKLGNQVPRMSSGAKIPEEEGQTALSQEPRAIRYKMAETSAEQFSEDGISRSSSFNPASSTSQTTSEEVPQEADSENTEEELRVISDVRNESQSNRTISGQSDDYDEDLSPIFISRHHTIDGKVGYAALDQPGAQLHQHLKNFGLNEQLGSFQAHEENPQLPPEYIHPNIDELSRIGTFVKVRRGGTSEEGSFRRRMLSPSSLPPIDDSAMLQEGSVEASTPKEFAQIQNIRPPNDFEKHTDKHISIERLSTPPVSHREEQSSTMRPGSGSPLKLFGTYNTFTNQKLLRRLSQFENDLPGDNSPNKLENTNSGDSGTGFTNCTEMNEAYIGPSSPSKPSNEPKINVKPSRKISRFGDGELNQFEFGEESLDLSRISYEGVKQTATKAPQDHDDQKSFSFHLQPSAALGSESRTYKRTRQVNTTLKGRFGSARTSIRRTSRNAGMLSIQPISHDPEVPDTPRKHYGDSESKRLLRSPSKDPTPKRRRTLRKTDILDASLDRQALDSVRETHEQIQSVVGRKRKDARHGDNQEPANPQVLAMRQILRPRTPTPTQRTVQDSRRSGLRDASGAESQRLSQEQQEKIARVQAELDSTVQLKTSTAMGIGQAMYSDSRKGSVTTQDFLDEAKKIMAGIRGKARPSSGLASVEESDSDHERQLSPKQELDEDDSYQESTREPFSRPPSREGPPLARLPQKQQDPEVLNHLKKYEEMSELDGIIASSLRSISMAKDAVSAANEIDRITDETVKRASARKSNFEEVYLSDPPNIQITEYPELQRKRKHSTSSIQPEANGHDEPQFHSHGSNASSGLSTGRSIPTGSSRGSDSKHVIAPHTVSHLIPEQLAGMVFDREKRTWAKRKTVTGEEKFQNDVQGEDTDDDPFGGIPDLTVDETQELHRIQEVAAKQREEARTSEIQRYKLPLQRAEQFRRDEPILPDFQTSGDNVESATSSEPSKYTRLASSTMTQDTRLTSWGNGHTPQPMELFPNGMHKEPVATVHSVEEKFVEEIEEEISIHEGRVKAGLGTLRRRNVTISFSSPLASIIPAYEDDEDAASTIKDVEEEKSGFIGQNSLQKSYTTKTRSSQQTPSRKMSVGGCAFVARPISRIEERDEELIISQMESGRRECSVSVVISTPLPTKINDDQLSMIPSSSMSRRSDGLLQLTPLADFTMNQPDESFALEVSYIGQRDRQHRSASERRTLSLSVKELVQRITDIEPYEPFWEHIKQLELRRKNLHTMHMLSKFCSQLEKLDVSENAISQLDGAPPTIRDLRITNNCLSDLSSWGQLYNLQYVDVSNNSLTSLDGFKNLVHLRGLRADNNKIVSLKGVIHLDGLISLRLRENMLESIDFAETKLHRLTELDLKGNRIQKVHNIQELRSLTTLNLEENRLSSFSKQGCEISWALKYLKLGGNILEELDVTGYPNIRLLYLDRNYLQRIMGLHKAKHLDSLSMREQHTGTNIDPKFLNEAFEVRKLFLSGNLLTIFAPSIDFLNLQYLELANCGLESLPIEFGQMVSNVRVLNLNFNALADIKPVLGIVRLKKIFLAGNRLARLRRTTNILTQFSSLTRVDLRNNPLTLGFYPSVAEKRLIIRDGLSDEMETLPLDPFTLQDGDKERDTAYTGRLDMETKMRRRVFEILMLGGCTRLKMLDGLEVDRTGLDIRDKVWEELVKAGVLYDGIPETETNESKTESEEQRDDLGEVDEAEKVPRSEAPEERWPAEDSFA